ncbi:MAG: NlpC/P60 family protein [Candidatus Thiodiazotropha lotti]|nr:NlpC/P60 family protein [Candidatus Thiodiazotropha lotti]
MRLENWPTLLNTYIESKRNTPFEWGVFDCLTFVHECTEEITGRKLPRFYRGQYSDMRGAYRLIQKHGGFDEIYCKYFGPQIPVNQARRGDLITHSSQTLPAAGVVIGTVAAFLGLNGLVFIDIKDCLKAWKVE